MTEITLNFRQYLELEKIGLGAYLPLAGFMNEDDFNSVVDRLRLARGDVFTLPVVMDIDAGTRERVKNAKDVALLFEGEEVGRLSPESVFTCSKQKVAEKIYGTSDSAHPGVAMFNRMGEHFVGGSVKLFKRIDHKLMGRDLSPQDTKKIIDQRGWKKTVGFQTRNVPHRAHEYLLKVALEQVDGIFIQPLVGWKKQGDFTPEAIITAYDVLIRDYFPSANVQFGILSTFMRYAGPREAVFHAIIRRNYGCTHFIVGRDHAGVGNYYGKYDAHEMARQFEGELGIEIMKLHGPYHCRICDSLVTEQTCPHLVSAPEATTQISGTDMRAILSGGKLPPPHLMRSEIVHSLKGVPIFVGDEKS